MYRNIENCGKLHIRSQKLTQNNFFFCNSIVRRSPQYVGSFAYPSYGRRNYGRSLFSYPSYGGYGGGYGRSFGGRGRRRGGFRRALGNFEQNMNYQHVRDWLDHWIQHNFSDQGTGLILGTAAFGGALIGAGLAQNGGFGKWSLSVKNVSLNKRWYSCFVSFL